MLQLSGNIDLSYFMPLEWGYLGFRPGNIFPMDESLSRHKGTQNPFSWVKKPEVQSVISNVWWNRTVAHLARQNLLTVDQLEQFVNWCEANPKTPDTTNQNNFSSVDMWIEWLAFHQPGPALRISRAQRIGRTTNDLPNHSLTM